MTRFSDAAMLKGDYAQMLKTPPKSDDWAKQTVCDNPAESVAQEVAKQIFQLDSQIDTGKEKLVVSTFSAHGPVTVMGIMPTEGYLLRIDGLLPDGRPVSMVQHVNQLSVSITKAELKPENANDGSDDDGLQIGFVIFDELKKRKDERKKPKRKAPAKRASGSRTKKK